MLDLLSLLKESRTAARSEIRPEFISAEHRILRTYVTWTIPFENWIGFSRTQHILHMNSLYKFAIPFTNIFLNRRL
jgi:hypothetical protein